MATELETAIFGEHDAIADDLARMDNEEIKQRIRALDTEIRIMKSDTSRVKHEAMQQVAHIKDNQEKVKLNKQLPYLVANVIEIVEPYFDPAEDGIAAEAVPEGQGVVVKTTTRQTVFLPVPGLVRASEVRPGELVGVNKDSYIMLEKLPTEFDSRVKAMEVDEKPTEDYTDIGGLDKQIQELIEAVVLPMTHAEKFTSIGIRAPKGVLLYGPPGTGKTLLARACAKNTDAVFLKLAGPQLVQQYIGDGAKLIRDAFDLAKEKITKEGRKGAIIFIDELDAIGTKRYGGEQSGKATPSPGAVRRLCVRVVIALLYFVSCDCYECAVSVNEGRPSTTLLLIPSIP